MTNFVNRSNNITEFPFQDYATLNNTELESLAEQHNLRVWNSWMLPQILAYFGSLDVYRNDKGFLDPRTIAVKNMGKDPWKIGLWRVCTKLKRSSLVKTQNTAAFANYSALVPLILAGFKKHQDIPYSQWDREAVELFVDANLYSAMTCEMPELTTARKLELREQGLTIKSGPKAGQLGNPISSWKLQGIKSTEIGDLPALATTMLGQIWVAHPSLRSKYMILDPNDWDAMPEPLIAVTPDVVEPKKFHSSNSGVDLPW
jgi:hypothetical protein